MMKIGDMRMCNTQIKEWYRWFKDGPTSVERNPLSDVPWTAKPNENNERVLLAVNEDRLLIVRELKYGELEERNVVFGVSR